MIPAVQFPYEVFLFLPASGQLRSLFRQLKKLHCVFPCRRIPCGSDHLYYIYHIFYSFQTHNPIMQHFLQTWGHNSGLRQLTAYDPVQQNRRSIFRLFWCTRFLLHWLLHSSRGACSRFSLPGPIHARPMVLYGILWTQSPGNQDSSIHMP